MRVRIRSLAPRQWLRARMSVNPISDPRTRLAFAPNLANPYFVGTATRLTPLLAICITCIAAGIYLISVIQSPESTIDRWRLVTEDLASIFRGDQYGSSEVPVFLPAWRDITFFVVFIVMGVTPWLAQRQWQGYERLIPMMMKDGTLVVRDRPRSPMDWQDEVYAANKWIHKVRFWRIPILGVSAAVCVAIFEAQLNVRVGPTTYSAQDGLPRIWWIAEQPVVAALYCIVVILGVYVVSIQNLVGCRIILAMFRLRRVLRFGVDYYNADGAWGWSPVRRILGATYAEVVLHGIALASIATVMPRDNILFWAVALPSSEWAATLPIYAIAPFAIIARGLKHNREFEARSLDALLSGRNMIARMDPMVFQRYAVFNLVPRIPFLGLSEKLLFIVAQVANFSACYAVIVGIISGGTNEGHN